MIATSTFQSERLLACGVSPKTADMSYRVTLRQENFGEYAWQTSILTTTPYSKAKDYVGEKKEPAWSLSALLTKVLPPEYKGESLMLTMLASGRVAAEYGLSTPFIKADDPIEVCVKMVEWLHKNKILK